MGLAMGIAMGVGKPPAKIKARGFTIIELMIALLLVSSLALLMTNYFKKSSGNLSESDRANSLESEAQMTTKLLGDEIRQVVYLNPSCVGNPMVGGVSLACVNVIVRGGIIPLPGASQEDVNALTVFSSPANLVDDPATLTDDNDAVRLVLFDEDVDCSLDRAIVSNPSDTSERLWVNPTACANELKLGQLYVIMETVGAEVFSNLFQITAIDNVASPSQIDIASTASLFNHVGGLGIAGYSNVARIYSVKLVEYAASTASQGLWRREIKPTGAALTGPGVWLPLQNKVENLQFMPLTVTTTGPISHNRTMQFTANTRNNGLEDLRGISPRVVLKSDRPEPTATVYDNPITTSLVENDHFSRRELNFFISMFNTQ